MERMSDLARRLKVPFEGRDVSFTGVTIDSRRVAPGDLFVALAGERFDGHAFLPQARESGAVGALVSDADAFSQDSNARRPFPMVVVADTLRGLQEYAQSWRGEFELPVIGVTGSNGKTTVKQMLAAICESRGPVLATRGNLNNHIGVPLTLLELREQHRTAVVEMGANHAGEIARLAELARPQVGIVNNAGDAHLEGFGSRDGVAKAKGELFEALGENGVAIVNADDAYAPLWKEQAGDASVITFGLAEDANVSAENPRPEMLGPTPAMGFELRLPEGRISVQLPLSGMHNVRNALAAAAAACALGIDAHRIVEGLVRAKPAPGRLAWVALSSGAQLIDDSYNANPTSLRAALELLVNRPGRHWLVLGDMAELGRAAEELHHAAGIAARELGVERLYSVGELAREAARGFGSGAVHFNDLDELVAELRQRLEQGVTVLVKGSRSAGMERVVERLSGRETGGLH